MAFARELSRWGHRTPVKKVSQEDLLSNASQGDENTFDPKDHILPLSHIWIIIIIALLAIFTSAYVSLLQNSYLLKYRDFSPGWAVDPFSIGNQTAHSQYIDKEFCDQIQNAHLVMAVATDASSQTYRQFTRYLIKPHALAKVAVFFVAGSMEPEVIEKLAAEARLYRDLIIGNNLDKQFSYPTMGFALAMQVLRACPSVHEKQVAFLTSEVNLINYRNLADLEEKLRTEDGSGLLQHLTPNPTVESLTQFPLKLQQSVLISKWAVRLDNTKHLAIPAFMMYSRDINKIFPSIRKQHQLCRGTLDRVCKSGILQFGNVLGLAASANDIQISDTNRFLPFIEGQVCTLSEGHAWKCNCDRSDWLLSEAQDFDGDISNQVLPQIMTQCPELYEPRQFDNQTNVVRPAELKFDYSGLHCSNLERIIYVISSKPEDVAERSAWRELMKAHAKDSGVTFLVHQKDAVIQELVTEQENFHDLIIGGDARVRSDTSNAELAMMLFWGNACAERNSKISWVIHASSDIALNVQAINFYLTHIETDGLAARALSRSDLNAPSQSNAHNVTLSQYVLHPATYPIWLGKLESSELSEARSNQNSRTQPITTTKSFTILSKLAIQRFASELSNIAHRRITDREPLLGVLAQNINRMREGVVIDPTEFNPQPIAGKSIWPNNPDLPSAPAFMDGLYLHGLSGDNFASINPHHSAVCKSNVLALNSCKCGALLAVASDHESLLEHCEKVVPRSSDFSDVYLVIDDGAAALSTQSGKFGLFDLGNALEMWSKEIRND